MGYVRAMSKYVVFTGRASRSEFWSFFVVLILALLLGAFIDSHMARANGRQPGHVYTAIIVLIHLLPAIGVQVRRLHDTNKPGLLVLLNMIPLTAFFMLFVYANRGTSGPNQYGPDPLQPVGSTPGEPPVASNGLASPSPAAATPRDLIAELERLAALKASGSLSEEEFDVMKARALSRA